MTLKLTCADGKRLDVSFALSDFKDVGLPAAAAPKPAVVGKGTKDAGDESAGREVVLAVGHNVTPW
eukprot:2270820-Prymnesium_polylepis.1